MTPSKLDVLESVVSLLASALSVPVSTDPAVPGVEVGEDDEFEARRTTSAVHTDVQLTIRSRAYDETTAKENGRTAAETLTDLNNLPAVASPFVIIDSRLDGHQLTIQRDVTGPDIHTDLLTITYRVTRT